MRATTAFLSRLLSSVLGIGRFIQVERLGYMCRGLDAVSIMGTMKARSVATSIHSPSIFRSFDVDGVKETLPECPKVLPDVAVPPA